MCDTIEILQPEKVVLWRFFMAVQIRRSDETVLVKLRPCAAGFDAVRSDAKPHGTSEGVAGAQDRPIHARQAPPSHQCALAGLLLSGTGTASRTDSK